MSPEDIKYYETQLDMFLTDGWKNFISNVNDLIESNRQTVFNIKESNEFFEAKGVMKTLVWLSSYEQIVRDSLKEAEEEDLYADV